MSSTAIRSLVMIRTVILTPSLALLLLGTLCSHAQTSGVEQTRAAFEQMADQLPYLALKSVLYDRSDHLFKAADENNRSLHFQVLGKATDGAYPKEALLELLSHDDPKVRTLAAVALFDREDPFVLPFLVKLTADEAPTFDGHPELSASRTWLWDTGIGPPPRKQTVGDIAKEMLGFYMTRSGFFHGVKHPSAPGFHEYWNGRKDRSHCAGWFRVQLARASYGRSPQKNCINRIRAVRKRIDEIPADDHCWLLLWLNGERGSDALVTESELVEMCKELGPDKLLLMLQHKIPSDDPDLQPRTNNNWPYNRMTLFVLRHAEELLRRDDGEALLNCERWQRDYRKHGIGDPTITPWWAVAAARLQPEKASRILHAALKRFQGKFDSDKRTTICVALWQLVGRSELAFLVDWLYDEQPQRSTFPHCRASFIEAIGKDRNGKEIIARIIRDRRLNNLGWQSLEKLVRLVNGWMQKPIVPVEEIGKAWHPFGPACFDGCQAEAEQKYPKETAELQKHFSEWSKRLRASVSTWLPNEQQQRDRMSNNTFDATR